MGAYCHTGLLEVGFQNVDSVASVCNAIIDVQLHHVFRTVTITVGDVFTDSASPLSVPVHAFPRRGAIRARVAGPTAGTCVFAVVFASEGEVIVPLQRLKSTLSSKLSISLLPFANAGVGSHVDAVRLAHHGSGVAEPSYLLLDDLLDGAGVGADAVLFVEGEEFVGAGHPHGGGVGGSGRGPGGSGGGSGGCCCTRSALRLESA